MSDRQPTGADQQPLLGMVLSGGGARGAYEAGVLSYIYQELPRPLVEGRIRVFCGTSVGAIHACYLAATAHTAHQDIGRLLEVWRGLHIDDMVRISATDLLRLPFDLRAMLKRTREVSGFLLNATLMQQIVTRDIPWPQIRRNLETGCIHALTVSATHIASGRTVVFVDRGRGAMPGWTRDQRRVPRAVQIGPLHALASAAIPGLFPPVAIEGSYYVDGGLRQNTPLSPALRMGIDRALIIGLSHPRDPVDLSRPPASSPEPIPGPFLLFGKVLDALLLDHLDYDVARLQGINQILADGVRAFGADFLSQINTTSSQIRGAPYRHVDALVVRPSKDIGEMASEFVETAHPKPRGIAGWVLKRIASEDKENNSDLLSYLTFDGRLASRLIDLGYHDADAMRDRLVAFFKA